MKQITVISGKGGTGKTSFTAAFAVLASQDYGIVIADCDVDAANLHLLFDCNRHYERTFVGGSRAVINRSECTSCNKCYELCRFGAIEVSGEEEKRTYSVSSLLCEGCGVCYDHCPSRAIEFTPAEDGTMYRSTTPFGEFFHAELNISHSNSGKLVTELLNEAREYGGENDKQLLLADGPPGVGCPVIASLTGADIALIITEPTLSGLHDLQRVQSLADSFGVVCAVIVNKADLNPAMSASIREHCNKSGASFLGEVPFDRDFVKSTLAGKTIVEYGASELNAMFTVLFNKIKQLLK